MSESESIEAPMGTWCKKGGRRIWTEDSKGSEYEKDEDEAEQGEGYVRVRFWGDGDCAGRVLVVNFGCSSEAHAVGGAVSIFSWREDSEELNESKLFRDFV